MIPSAGVMSYILNADFVWLAAKPYTACRAVIIRKPHLMNLQGGDSWKDSTNKRCWLGWQVVGAASFGMRRPVERHLLLVTIHSTRDAKSRKSWQTQTGA